jgi:hypothetical protein
MIEYHYSPEQRLLTVTVSGRVTADEFHRGFPDVPVGTLELVDMTRAKGAEVSASAVHGFAHVDRSSPTRITRMAIVANTSVGYGMARMYETLMEGSGTEVQVFRELEAARRWLGVTG